MKYIPLLLLLTACCRCPEPDPLAYYRGFGEGVKAGADAVEEVYSPRDRFIVVTNGGSLTKSVTLGDIGFDPETDKLRSVTVSNLLYVVLYRIHSTQTYSIPATIPPGEPHYDCTVTVWQGTNQIGTPIETQWTEKGCWEDDPLTLVKRAQNWK